MRQFFDPTENRHPAMEGGEVFAELRGIMAALSPEDAGQAATARALLSWHDGHRHCSRCGARSVIAQAGWQRDCPNCNASHFPRTDPVVIVLATKGREVLLGRSHG